MSREETLQEIVERRNKRLLHFFTHGYDVGLFGEAKKPAVVLYKMAVLSYYVKNFDLHFTKEPFTIIWPI